MNRMAIALLVLFAASGCTRGDAQQKAAALAAVPVSAVQLAPKAVPIVFEAVARTEGSKEVQIRTRARSEEHTSELQSQSNLVCRLLLEKKKKNETPARLTPSGACDFT